MKKISGHPVPPKISEFINKNFDKGFLADIKIIRKNDGRFYYKVEVSQDDTIHNLKFNEKGELISREMEPVFPTDPHEGEVGEEGFYEGNY